MADQGHTPLPWHRLPGEANSGHPIYKQGRIVIRVVKAREPDDNEFQRVCLVDSDTPWQDAALIVKAVNSHKALVEALRDLLTYDRVERPAMRTHPHGAPGSTVRIATDKLIALEDAAKAALKLAGEA